MKYQTAVKLLKKRAEDFYGKDFDWLVDSISYAYKVAGHSNESMKITEAYKVYIRG
jgi:hypothetical protein